MHHFKVVKNNLTVMDNSEFDGGVQVKVGVSETMRIQLW